MQFEKTGDSAHPYLLTFEHDEIDTVKAVFREEMFKNAQKGNVGSISDYDVTMADWSNTKETMRTRVTSPERFAERLEEFHGATGDAIIDVAHESGTPAFLNDEIPYRLALGGRALELASQIRQHVTEQTALTEAEIVAFDADTELSNLLGSDSEDQD